MRIAVLPVATAIHLVFTSMGAFAGEFPIGKPEVTEGLEIAAVYLQPIEMEPSGLMASALASDIHLEADIHATAENRNGFAEGDWVPNLEITYSLTKEGETAVTEGVMMSMVASDGPHYGDNVKLSGPGRYRLVLTVKSSTGMHQMFGRHVDKETGVADWPNPIVAEYDFVFAGTGKKGGY
jgi:periplasmic iron binding protein